MWDDICESRPVVLSMSEPTHNKQAQPYHIRRQSKLQIGWNVGDVSLLASCGGHLPVEYRVSTLSSVGLHELYAWYACLSIELLMWPSMCIMGVYRKKLESMPST